MAYYLQNSGFDVVPVATWCTSDDFEWCFDGLPEESSIAISSNGCMSNPYSKKILLQGVDVLQKQKNPTNLIVCGREVQELEKYDKGQNVGGGGASPTEDTIYDVAYKNGNTVYVLSNTQNRIYQFIFADGNFDEGYYSDITVGTKEAYGSRIATEFPGISNSEIKNEVIIDGLDTLYIIRETENSQFLCRSKDENSSYTVIQYERDDAYNTSNLPYSECEEEK